MKTILPKLDKTEFSSLEAGGLQKILASTGRLPPISIKITPLVGTPFYLDRFLNYDFTSSILIPVDSFSFDFVAPDDPRPFNQIVKEGDLVRIYANGVALSTGIIDQTDVEMDADHGETVKIQGRNLLSQFEDQNAVDDKNAPIYAKEATIDQVFALLKNGTRLPALVKRNATSKAWLFATEPGESKMQALLRYLEPLNLLAWTDELGNLVVGKPNMSQKISGTIFCSKEQRASNVTSIKCVRSSATIPNFIVPIWQGQEEVVKRIASEQGFKNAAKGPARLLKNGHRVTKTIVVSSPQGSSAQDLADVNQLKIAAGNLLQAYGKKELARDNVKELQVEAVVPGHYNDKGEKFHTDHTYRVIFDRGDVDEVMYLYQVRYQGGEGTGQKSVLSFTKLGTIVSDIPVP